MQPLDLDPRLAAVAALVPRGARVADIGCDHARLPIALALSGAERAIGIDRAKAPLEGASRNVRRSGADVELRMGDGLDPLSPGEIDCVTIAGVGGDAAIQAIPLETLVRLRVSVVIVQVNKKTDVVRRTFFDAGWTCTDESVVWRKGRPFVTSRFDAPARQSATAIAYDAIDLIVGPALRESHEPGVDEFIAHQRDWLEDVERTSGRSNAETLAALRNLEEERSRMAK